MNDNGNTTENKAVYSFTSPHFSFRCITEGDTDIIVKWRSTPDIIRYFRSPLPVTRESHLKWYHENYLCNQNRYDFVVLDDGEPVGFVALIREYSQSRTAEINYTIGNPKYRGLGYGHELIDAIVNFGYQQFGVMRFVAVIHRDNIPSQKAAVRSGFLLADDSEEFLSYVRRFDHELCGGHSKNVEH